MGSDLQLIDAKLEELRKSWFIQIRNSHTEEIRKLQETHDESITKLKEEHDSAILKVQETHKEDLKNLFERVTSFMNEGISERNARNVGN